MKDAELGWVAGIIDGEGCIGIYRNRDTRPRKTDVRRTSHSTNHQLVLIVSNTDAAIIARLKELCGGAVRADTRKAKPQWQPSWHWTLSSRPSKALLTLLLPHLVGKQDEARLALQFNLKPAGVRSRTPAQMEANEDLRLQLRVFKGHARG